MQKNILPKLEVLSKELLDAGESGIRWGPIHPVVAADASLFLQDRKDLIKGFVDDSYLTESDLRYHPEMRKKVYSQIKENPERSYYELAKSKGFDPGRFYGG